MPRYPVTLTLHTTTDNGYAATGAFVHWCLSGAVVPPPDHRCAVQRNGASAATGGSSR
jgi:hypothetical protein